jgi:signal recognition particle subunit SRP19
MIRKSGYIIWARFFDARKSRSQGRRVPTNLAVKNPTIEMIVGAAVSLGWPVEPLEVKHPSEWWRKSSAVLVKPPAGLKKSEVTRLIAQRLRERR